MNKRYLYIITNISMPGICKVGITNDVERRLKALNGKTEVPTRFQVYEVFDLGEKAQLMEQLILQEFAKQRVNVKREFLEIHPEILCEFVRRNKNKLKEEKITKGLFNKLGLKEGEVFYFTEGGNLYKDIKAYVGKGRNIIYNNKSMSMSKAAVKILNNFFGKNWKAAQGTIYWTYKNKTIRELMDENNFGLL